MTDRINTITVVLETNVRDDDILPTLNAIRQLRGVQRVEPNVARAMDEFAGESRANERWRRALATAAQEAQSR